MEYKSNQIKEEFKQEEQCNVYQEYVILPDYNQEVSVASDNNIWMEPSYDNSLSYLVNQICQGSFDVFQQDLCIQPDLISLSPTHHTSPLDPQKEVKRKKKTTCCTLEKKKKITAYDTETTAYLQSVFFDTYSKQSKLTKQQRREVQEKTGLPSRNITYWFSNHKRRFQHSLNLFKKTNKNSNLTYNDFIKWRRKQNISDQEYKS